MVYVGHRRDPSRLDAGVRRVGSPEPIEGLIMFDTRVRSFPAERLAEPEPERGTPAETPERLTPAEPPERLSPAEPPERLTPAETPERQAPA